MMRARILKAVSGLIPERILRRPSVQIVRSRLAVAQRLRRSDVGAGVPVVCEFRLDDSAAWRAQFAAALWSLSRAASASHDRMAWMLCIGLPPESPEDLYALAVQADPVVQLHILTDQAEAQDFTDRYVPPASLQEARARRWPDIVEALSQAGTLPNAFTRATSTRAAAHTFVKQIGGESPVVVVHIDEAPAVIAALRAEPGSVQGLKILVVGDILGASDQIWSNADVLLVRRMGYTLLEELALVQACDGYVGYADHYAILAAEAGIPCLLSNLPASFATTSGGVSPAVDILGDFPRWLSRHVNNVQARQ